MKRHAYSSLYWGAVAVGGTADCVLRLALVIWICDVWGLTLVSEESDVWVEQEVMEGRTASVSVLCDVPVYLVFCVTLVDFFLSMVISVLVEISFSTIWAEISSSMVTCF